MEERRPFRSLVGERQLPFHAGLLAFNIVKMHGDLRHEEHVIITRRDYDGFLSEYPVVATHLSAMLIARTALFIGYSRQDPDFQQVVDVVQSRLGRFRRMSYMVQFDAAPEDIEAALDEQMHVISLDTTNAVDRDTVLAEFFVEIQTVIDKRAGMNFRQRHPNAFEVAVPDTALTSVLDQPAGVRVLEGTSQMCFVTMPFNLDLEHVYDGAIAPAVEAAGLTTVRADQIAVPGGISEHVRAAIQNARLCIADTTGSNPNIMYEVGIAQTMDKPLILVSQDSAPRPLDPSSKVVQYDPDDIEGLRQTLCPTLATILQEGKLEEAERLMATGSYAAAISVLSVLLEQLLRQRLIDAVPKLRRNLIRVRGLGSLIDELQEAGGLDDLPQDQLRAAVKIRNTTVHGVKEPSRTDAALMLDVVSGAMASSRSC